jgi:uncharacterized protein (DUF2336 family)
MIVRQFLNWVRTAPPGERAEATSALARAYLFSNLTESDRAAAEGAMTMLLDDPSPLVRLALSEAFTTSESAPPAIVHSLACDQPEIAAPLLEHSPLLLDADLVEAVASGEPLRQAAVAARAYLPCAVSAAIAEVGNAESCLVLLENPEAEIVPVSLDRIVDRHGHLAAIREVLLARDDLTPPTRQALIAKLSQTLALYVVSREWLSEERAGRVTHEACEKATVALAGDSPEEEVRPLVRHLRESGQLTTGLVLRALLCGNVTLFEETLAELSGLPLARVAAIVHDRHRGASFRAVYDRAGLPASTFLVFRDVLDALRDEGMWSESGAGRLRRNIIERVLTRCESADIGEVEPLLTLLHRYAAEAAREDARQFCDDLIAVEAIEYSADDRLAAA